jgi:CO dehydrogenase maturation factor
VVKIAISGKGGVGKTTLAGLLAHVYAARGQDVIAIDADPDANLASALGFSEEGVARITPISELEELIEERTGAKPGTFGSMFKMNPRVDDIPERFSLKERGIRLLVMGTVEKGGSGCVCPESVMLKSLVTHLLLRSNQVLIMDMEAGIEHLGRATAGAVDAFIVVVEPGKRSVQTAQTVAKLASDIGVRHVYAVANKVRGEEDRAFIAEHLPDMAVLGYMPVSPLAIQADLQGASLYDLDPNFAAIAEHIVDQLESLAAPAGRSS